LRGIYKAGLVPVGIDQEPHIEVAREIARAMNQQFGTDFPEPRRFATAGEYVPSLAGEGKMSKSVEGSYINITDDLVTIQKRLAGAPTDSGKGRIEEDVLQSSTKTRKTYIDQSGKISPGVASLLQFVELFQGAERRTAYEAAYTSTGVRYGDLKKELAQAILTELQPLQERRRELEADPQRVDAIIADGAARARTVAEQTAREVRVAMGLA
jgi:tryptophanyl-tRNA synthetase